MRTDVFWPTTERFARHQFVQLVHTGNGQLCLGKYGVYVSKAPIVCHLSPTRQFDVLSSPQCTTTATSCTVTTWDLPLHREQDDEVTNGTSTLPCGQFHTSIQSIKQTDTPVFQATWVSRHQKG